MSDTAKSTPAAKTPAPKAAKAEAPAPAATPAATPAAAPADGAAAAPAERKVGREAMGGAAVGHYGFFSNIKTPEYKSGWDDIWGKKKKPAKKAAAAKEPVTVTLDPADLSPAVRRALAAAAKEKLGRSKAAYDRAEKAATLDWRIEVTVPR